MSANRYYQRVCATLEADSRRLWGRIQEAEVGTCGVGGSSRWAAGTRSIQLKTLFRYLHALGLDPAGFFARALGRPTEAEALLADLIAGHRGADRVWREVESAVREVERTGDLKSAGSGRQASRDAGKLLATFASAGRREQMRRLRKTARYRDPDVALALLRYLDALRDVQPERAQALAARLAIQLVPAIPGPFETRIELACGALGVFGSALRARDDRSTAARAFFLALQLTQRHQLYAGRARLLSRIARLLEDTGHADMALIALREALEIQVHSGDRLGLGKTMVLQAKMYCALEEHEKAISVLQRALLHLPKGRPELNRHFRRAYETLAFAQQGLGNPREARAALASAADYSPRNQPLILAGLLPRTADASPAGPGPSQAAAAQSSSEGLQAPADPLGEAFTAVGRVHSLMTRGKLEEACEVASEAAGLLGPLAVDPAARDAVERLVQAGDEGRLTRGVLRDARGHLQRALAEAR